MHRAVFTENLFVEEATRSESEIWLSVMSSCVCNPPGNSMASTVFPNHTVRRHIPGISKTAPGQQYGKWDFMEESLFSISTWEV